MNGLIHGRGKVWFQNGNIFLGNFQCNKMDKGRLYEVRPNNTYTAKCVEYNFKQDALDRKRLDNQLPSKEKLESEGLKFS